jgi:hypothetical protein
LVTQDKMDFLGTVEASSPAAARQAAIDRFAITDVERQRELFAQRVADGPDADP